MTDINDSRANIIVEIDNDPDLPLPLGSRRPLSIQVDTGHSIEIEVGDVLAGPQTAIVVLDTFDDQAVGWSLAENRYTVLYDDLIVEDLHMDHLELFKAVVTEDWDYNNTAPSQA